MLTILVQTALGLGNVSTVPNVAHLLTKDRTVACRSWNFQACRE